ncbi:MAG: peptidoglycan editing factor PgeF [Alphaproteobacteria bacterium]|nr:peptidoglycan editing factor PgeF [Alphaproteobacteria bacterium]
MILTRALPDAPRGVVHGFTGRAGGVSVGSLGTLNLAMRPGETTDALTENWRRVLHALDPGLELGDLALVNQVHGDRVLRVDAGGGPLATLGDADALVTTARGVVLAVRTADCVPVLFAVPGGVAAAHAGWRGVAAAIVPATLRALCEATGASPADVRVAVGPHIGPDVYEVGPEVVEGIVSTGVPADVFVRRGRHVDLRAAVVQQLVAAGVERIGHDQRCTASRADLFSHRADGPETGRLAGVIGRVG